MSGVDDPYLAGLLAAKSAAASEAGVTLRGVATRPGSTVGWRTRSTRSPSSRTCWTTAIRAASEGSRTPGRVEVTLLGGRRGPRSSMSSTAVTGSPRSTPTSCSTTGSRPATAAPGHGIGLALARHTARAHGGDVRLVDPGGSEHRRGVRGPAGRRPHRARPVEETCPVIRVLVVDDDFRVAQLHASYVDRDRGLRGGRASRTPPRRRCGWPPTRGPTWCCSTSTCPTATAPRSSAGSTPR